MLWDRLWAVGCKNLAVLGQIATHGIAVLTVLAEAISAKFTYRGKGVEGVKPEDALTLSFFDKDNTTYLYNSYTNTFH